MRQHHPFLPGIFRSLLIVVVILNTTIPVRAEENIRDEEPSVLTSTDISQGLTLGTESGSNAENEVVPILSEDIEKQAQADIEAMPVHLELSAEPAIYIDKKPIIIKWEVNNISQSGTSGYKIVARPPDGVLPVNKTDVPETDGSVIISPKSNNGIIAWQVLDSAQFPLVFNYELVSGGKVLDSNSVLINKAQFSITANQRTAQATSFTNDVAGKVRVDLPIAAVRSPLAMDIRYPSPNALRGSSLTWNPVEIIAVDVNTQKNVTKFSTPITISINYDENNIFDWDERNLTIFYYDPKMNDWFPIETTVNTETNTLTAQSDHLTVFDYKANNWQSVMAPTVDAFKTSDFTGSGTYQINLWTPPAPGGLQPSVVLSYNSQIIDEAPVYTQASWVGMGWGLDTGSITLDLHGTYSQPDDENDDTHSISVAGTSSLLLRTSFDGNIAQYNTADQSFMKVESNDNQNSFTVWTKDGKKYEFTETTDNNYNSGCATANNHTWRWNLKKVTDVHGNIIDYTYYTEFKSPSCANEIAVYPATITYGNGKYSIEFVREARADYQTSWTTSASTTLYGTSRLKEVLVKHNAVTIKRYALSYAPNDATNIYPNFNFSAGGKTLTLAGVQEFDGSGNALPAVTFTYGDAMHLTEVNNGQGGTVAMNYSAWQYVDDVNVDAHSFKTIFQTTPDSYGCAGVPTGVMPGSWIDTVGLTYCDGTGYLRLGKSSELGRTRLVIPEYLIKPGNQYRFAVNARRITAGCLTSTQALQYGFEGGPLATAIVCDTTTTDQIAFLTSSTGLLSTSKLRLACSGCFIRSFEFNIQPTYYRATSRTVTTQPNQPKTPVSVPLSPTTSPSAPATILP